MHPGNRLPSISMTVVLIGFLFLVGYLNTTESAKENKSAIQPDQISVELAAASKASVENNSQYYYSTAKASNKLAPGNRGNVIDVIKESNAGLTGSKNGSNLNYTQPKRPASLAAAQTTAGKSIVTISNSTAEEATYTAGADVIPDNAATLSKEKNTIAFIQTNERFSFDNTVETVSASNNPLNGSTEDFNEEKLLTQKTVVPAVVSLEPVYHTPVAAGTEISTGVKAGTAPSTNIDKPVTVQAVKNINQASLNDKAWMEDFVLHNKPVARKWAGKLALQAYITPSVVYRKIRNNAVDKQLAGTNSNFNNFNADDVVKHRPSFGLETGLSLQYDISRRIRLKAGVQFNYTRYNAFAYETNHPVASTLTMNADDNIMTYEVFRTSNFTNIYGNYSTKLHNETYQLSLPAGVDYKVANISENVAWYAGATIQPTILLHARSFVLSTDRRSYVEDPTLLNRFNINAGFETYFSFNKSGYTLQLGPQYRTQLLSTNTKVYSLEERLQNFGLKLGIAKRL